MGRSIRNYCINNFVSLGLRQGMQKIFKYLFRTETPTDDTIQYYRERIFNLISFTFLVTGLFAVIAGIFASIKYEMYSIAVFDALAYVLLLFIHFNRRASLLIRKILLMILPYMVGVFFMFNIGPGGPGFAYLVGFNILGAILLGYRTTIYTLSCTFLTLIVLTGVIYFNVLPGTKIHEFGTLAYFAAGINVILIGSVSSLPLAFLVKSLEKKLLEQELLQKKLKKNIHELSVAKEKAEESDRLKTAFLHNMSHEIRTPLNGIVGFSEMLTSCYNDKDKLKHFSSIISRRSNDLLNIINDILDLARIESGAMTVHLQECKIHELLEDIEEFFITYKSKQNKDDVKLLFNFKCEKQKQTVLIDQGKLNQILVNLISNAIKFTKKGNVEVGCVNEYDDVIRFYVKDTGIGIGKEEQKLIFNRFMQATEDTSQFYGGTGLGLPIVKGILDILGGEIKLESEKGKGSRFDFTIPYKAVTEKVVGRK